MHFWFLEKMIPKLYKLMNFNFPKRTKCSVRLNPIEIIIYTTQSFYLWKRISYWIKLISAKRDSRFIMRLCMLYIHWYIIMLGLVGLDLCMLHQDLILIPIVLNFDLIFFVKNMGIIFVFKTFELNVIVVIK